MQQHRKSWNRRQVLLLPLAVLALVFLFQPASGQRGFDPETALQKLQVAEGLKVELFAAEPLVRQPVTMTIDDRNRVWVIQYLQYPEPAGLSKVAGDRYDRIRYDRVPKPPPHGPRGADRITILEDTDGDGRADQANDFVDGLNLASGLALGHGGVWVLQSPYLLFYPDRDSDDRPDGDPEVRLVGFGLDDAHSVANSLQWGPDGWLYGAHGSTVNANVRGVRFQQGIWRYHPSTDRFELFSEGGGNTYGLDFDRLGNAIAGTNWGVPGLHQMQGAYHVKIFSKHGALHNPHAFGYFPHMPHEGTDIGKLSVGGIFYQAKQWPERFQDKFITANPLNHALYTIEVLGRGSTFSTRFQERLVWSDDAWFQPVDLVLDTDGSVLVADWYDGNINYQITYRNRDNFDSKRGRIYRISSSQAEIDRDTQRSPEQDLYHPNVHLGRRALRALVEQEDKTRVAEFSLVLEESEDEEQCLQALWALNLCHPLHQDDRMAIRCLQHRFPAVRAWSVRLLGDPSAVSPAVGEQLSQMAREESDVRVRTQLACTAKRLPGPDGLAIVAGLARHDEDATDPYLPLLLWWAVEANATSDQDQIMAWLEDSKIWQSPLMRDTIIPRLARRYAAEGDAAGFTACANLLALAPTSDDVERVIGGMEQQLQGLKQGEIPHALRTPLAELWKDDNHPTTLVLFALRMGNDDALREAVTRISDPNDSERDRIALIEAVGQTGKDSVIQPLAELFQHSDQSAIRSAALASLARYSKEEIGNVILTSYKSLRSELRGEARQVLYSRVPWSQQLLRTIEGGDLNAAEIPYGELTLLLNHGDASIRELVQKHWGKVRQVTPQEKRDRMMELGKILSTGTGDIAQGKRLFTKHCGTCHQLHGEGNKIGPDLTPYPRHELAYLLLHTVDPNAVVRPEYQSVVIVTDDGRVLTGLLTESTPQTVALVDAKNTLIVLAREEIEEMEDSPQSLMPEKLFESLSDNEIRDLFANLQSKTSEPLRNDLSSLLGLQETFDVASDAWVIANNGTQTTPRFQASGGNPTGWLQLDDTVGGDMAIVLPESWYGRLQNYHRGTLSFDARTVTSNGGLPHTVFGLVEITGAGRTVRCDVTGPGAVVPGKSWTTYRVALNAKQFGVEEGDWNQIINDVSRVTICVEAFSNANEKIGLDNISLRAP